MVVLRKVDFETGDLSQLNMSSGTTRIDTAVVHGGKYSVRTEAPPTSSCFLWGWNPKLPENKNLYYELWYYTEPTFNVPPGPYWALLAEICAPHPVSCNQHVAIMVKTANGIKNNVMIQFFGIADQWGIPGFFYNDSGESVSERYTGLSLPLGKWVHFEIYVNTDMNNGVISVRMDGVEIYRWTGRTVFDAPINPDSGLPNDEVSFTVANYNSGEYGVGFGTTVFWFDDIYIGTEPSPTSTFHHILIITATTGGTTSPAPERYDYGEGASAIVTAVPDASYRFDHWELDGTTRTENPVTIVMDMDYSLRAVFEELPPPPPEKRYLTIVAINGQTSPAQGTYELDLNSTQTVTATPNSGYKFKEWLLDNAQAGTQPFITVTIDMNHMVVAMFEEEVTPPPVQAGIPIWVIPVALLGAGVLYLAGRKK